MPARPARVRISHLASEWGVDFPGLLAWLSGAFPCVRDDPTMTVSADLADVMRLAVAVRCYGDPRGV